MLIWNFIGFIPSRPQYNQRPWIFMLLQWCFCDVCALSTDLISQTLRLITELCIIKLLSSWSHTNILKLLPPRSTRLANFACWSLPSLNWSSFTKASYLAGGRRAALPWPLYSVLIGTGSSNGCRPSTSLVFHVHQGNQNNNLPISTLYGSLNCWHAFSHLTLDMILWSWHLVILAPVYTYKETSSEEGVPGGRSWSTRAGIEDKLVSRKSKCSVVAFLLFLSL